LKELVETRALVLEVYYGYKWQKLKFAMTRKVDYTYITQLKLQN